MHAGRVTAWGAIALNGDLHTGVVAAGDTLLKDPRMRDAIREKSSARAIEMEAVGFRDAAYAGHIEFIVVRGIVDYCDKFKADDYRAKASVSAAAVLKLLFETLGRRNGRSCLQLMKPPPRCDEPFRDGGTARRCECQKHSPMKSVTATARPPK